MNNRKTAEIRTSSGEVIQVPMSTEHERKYAKVFIDDVAYHFERMSRSELLTHYKVDDDPDYTPKSDGDDCCYLLAPYSD